MWINELPSEYSSIHKQITSKWKYLASARNKSVNIPLQTGQKIYGVG